MSPMLLFTSVWTVTLGARAIVTVWPSRDLTANVWPSSFSTVPRMRVGVPSGAGVCASAEIDRNVAQIAASSVLFRMSRPPLVLLPKLTVPQKWPSVCGPHLTFRLPKSEIKHESYWRIPAGRFISRPSNLGDGNDRATRVRRDRLEGSRSQGDPRRSARYQHATDTGHESRRGDQFCA